jgi:ribosome-binding protein aMBF1 (putative translation factor)
MAEIDHHAVRDRRDELDLSNDDVAQRIDSKSTYVVNIMCGAAKPSMRMVHRLSRALDLPVEKILKSSAKGKAARKVQSKAAA